MASVKSLVRTLVKPILFKLMGKSGYKYAQLYGKIRDIENRLVEEKEMALLPLIVREGDTVLDIGANYAYYCERLSKLVGKSGTVHAFEPIPFTHEVCAMIVKKLNLNNVNLHNKGISDTTMTVEFSVPKLDFGGISAGQSHISGRTIDDDKKKEYYNFDAEEKVLCEVVALDEYLGDKIANLSFVKIDIEGAEYMALKGMEKMIEIHKPILLLEIQPTFLKGFNIEEADFRNYLLTDLGYHLFVFNAVTIKLNAYSASTFADDNYILIHADKLASQSHIIE
jgi:FkbM family methyltransferase